MNDTLSQVRIATWADADCLYSQRDFLHEENGMFSLDDNCVMETIEKALNKQGSIIGVIGEPGKIEASIYLDIIRPWYSREFHLYELWNYVCPDYRKLPHAKALLEFAKTCGDQMNLKVLVSILTHERLEAKERFYARNLPKAGAFYLYSPEKRAA